MLRPIPGTRQAGETRQQRRLLGNRPTKPGLGFGPTQGTLPTFRNHPPAQLEGKKGPKTPQHSLGSKGR